jgi:two-component system, cell cycle response regulator CtrA
MCILLVEKHPSAATSNIGDDHGIVVCAEDADEAMSLLHSESYDLVLISMASTPRDGLDVIRRMRASKSATPVIALTGSRIDSSEALRLGADDAMAESVDTAELDARIAAILQRQRGVVGRRLLRLGELVLCLATREAQFRGMLLDLTAKEFSVLELLVLRRGSVLTKLNFLSHLYDGVNQPDANIVDVFICKLRKKLERAGAGRLVSVVWGHGYMISELDALRQRVSDIITIERRGMVAQ